jgi:putative membrane protein
MIRFLATAAALWVAASLVPGISHTGSALALLGVAAVFGVVNTLIAPIIKLLAFPFIIMTLGLVALLINAAMLMLTSWFALRLNLGFHVDGFAAAFIGALVISFVSAALGLVFDNPASKAASGA